jgi:hypothetical protein
LRCFIAIEDYNWVPYKSFINIYCEKDVYVFINCLIGRNSRRVKESNWQKEHETISEIFAEVKCGFLIFFKK